MSINPTFIDFINKLARVESITNTSFHDEAVAITKSSDQTLSETLYQIKTTAIRIGVPQWQAEGRNVTVTRYRYGGSQDYTYTFVVEVASLDNKRSFKFHIFDWDGDFVNSNDIHHSRSSSNKVNTQLPFSDLKWLEKLLQDLSNFKNDNLDIACVILALDADITISEARNRILTAGETYGINELTVAQDIKDGYISIFGWYCNSMSQSIIIHRKKVIFCEEQFEGDSVTEIEGSQDILDYLVDCAAAQDHEFVRQTLKKLFNKMQITN